MANLALAFDILAKRDTGTPALKRVGNQADRTGKQIKKAGDESDRAGRRMSGGFGAAAKAAGAVSGIFAGISLVGFFKEASAEARESVKVGKVTAQVIKSTGGAAKITSQQVGDLATSISNATGKDDELVQSGANLLLTFKNVRNEVGKGNQIFNRATTAAVDLSAAGFGSVEGASKMLGKALNDPLKGISALGRAGVTFSAQQKEQIKRMTESGNVLGAQKIIMAEVESQVGGVAAASADASEKYAVASGNFKELVGTVLKPIGDAFYNVMTTRVFPALSEAVKWLEIRVPRAINWTKTAFGGLTALLGQGEFTSAFREAFHVEEDSPIVDFILKVRDGVLEVSGFVRSTVLPALGQLKDFIVGTLLPAWVGWYGFLIRQMLPILKDIGRFFVDSVVPAFKVVVDFVVKEVVPGFLEIVETVKGLIRVVAPIIREIVGVIIDKFTEMRPQIESIWTSVKEIVTGAMFIIREVIQAVTTIIRLVWDRWGEQIKTIVGSAFTIAFRVVSGLMKSIAGVIKLVVALIKGDWSGAWNAIKQIFSGVWQAIRTILGTYLDIMKATIGRGLGTVRGIWDRFWGGVKTSTSNAIGAVRTTIATVLDRIRTGVGNAVGAIGRAWDGIREKFRGPVDWVINNVLKRIAGAYDKIAGIVGAAKINLSTGGPVNMSGRAAAVGRAAGGPIRGRGGPRQDNIVGLDRATGMQTSWVSAGEFVVNAKAYQQNRELVETINASGRQHGPLRDRVRRALGGVIPRLFLGGAAPTQTARVSKHSGYPWARWAGDLNGPGDDSGQPVRAWKAGIVAAVRSLTGSYGKHIRINHGAERTLYAHLSRIGVSAGQRVSAGQQIGNLGSTGNSSGPHLHFEISGGSSPLSGAIGSVKDAVINAIKPREMFDKSIGRLVNGLAARIPGGNTPLGGLLGGMARKLVGAARNKLPESFGQQAGSTTSSPNGSGGLGPRAAAARRWVIANTGITNIGGYANRNIAGTNTPSKHSMGKAIDVMTYDAGIHSKVANEFVRNAGRWGTDNVITRGRIWNQRGWHKGVGSASGHFDHVHVDFFKNGGEIGKALGGLGAIGMAAGGLVKGGRGGVLAHIGEGSRDELVQPLPRGWRSGASAGGAPAVIELGPRSIEAITAALTVELDGRQVARAVRYQTVRGSV